MKTRKAFASPPMRTIGLVTAGLLLLAGCGNGSGSSETGGGPTEENLIIGLNLELTGPGSFLGEGMREGIERGVERINADGGVNGRSITLIVKDNESDPSRAVSRVSELKREGATLILGPGFAQNCAAVAPTLIREDIVGVCISAGDLPEEDAHMFGVGLDYKTMEESIAQQFADADITDIGLVAASDTSGDQTVASFQPAAEALNLNVAIERFNSPANDLSPQLLRANGDSPDVLRLQATGPDALVGVSNVRALGITTPVWLPNSAASLRFADQVKGDVGGGNIHTWIPAMLSPTGVADHPEQAAQIEALSEALPTADTISAAGWDALQLSTAAIAAAPSTETSDLIAAFESGEKYYGAYSVQQITADDHRGASSEGTLLPAVFTTDGNFELVGQ